MTVADSKKTKDIVIPIDEARGLRDEVASLLSDLYSQTKNKSEEIIELEVKGKGFK